MAPETAGGVSHIPATECLGPAQRIRVVFHAQTVVGDMRNPQCAAVMPVALTYRPARLQSAQARKDYIECRVPARENKSRQANALNLYTRRSQTTTPSAMATAMLDTLLPDLKASLSPTSAIVTPDSDNYAESIKRWSDAVEKRAALIIFPTSAADVRTSLLFAQSHHLDLAICCAGHSTGGASSTSGGLCIDLKKLRSVTVDPVARTITAGGGCTWSDVNKAAAEHGLATVGGNIDHTGIGGLTLGGGMGWLTPQHGLVIDNLLEVEIVLADGTMTRASESQNPDLFWAVRGAGSCFGVVTEFVYRAHAMKGLVWAGLLGFPATKLEEVFDWAGKAMENENENEKQAFVVAFGCLPPAFRPCIACIVFYDGSEEEAKEAYEGLLKLEPFLDRTGPMPYWVTNTLGNQMQDYGDRKSMKGSAFFNPLDQAFVKSAFEDYVGFVEEIPDAKRSVLVYEFLHPKQVIKVAPTATAYANRGNCYNFGSFLRWTDKVNDDACRAFARTMSKKFDEEFVRQKSMRNVDKHTLDAVGYYPNHDGEFFNCH